MVRLHEKDTGNRGLLILHAASVASARVIARPFAVIM